MRAGLMPSTTPTPQTASKQSAAQMSPARHAEDSTDLAAVGCGRCTRSTVPVGVVAGFKNRSAGPQAIYGWRSTKLQLRSVVALGPHSSHQCRHPARRHWTSDVASGMRRPLIGPPGEIMASPYQRCPEKYAGLGRGDLPAMDEAGQLWRAGLVVVVAVAVAVAVAAAVPLESALLLLARARRRRPSRRRGWRLADRLRSSSAAPGSSNVPMQCAPPQQFAPLLS